MNSFAKVKFEVDSNCNLDDEHEHKRACKGGVYVRGELATFMLVAEEPSNYGDDGPDGLEGNMPS